MSSTIVRAGRTSDIRAATLPMAHGCVSRRRAPTALTAAGCASKSTGTGSAPRAARALSSAWRLWFLSEACRGLMSVREVRRGGEEGKGEGLVCVPVVDEGRAADAHGPAGEDERRHHVVEPGAQERLLVRLGGARLHRRDEPRPDLVHNIVSANAHNCLREEETDPDADGAPHEVRGERVAVGDAARAEDVHGPACERGGVAPDGVDARGDQDRRRDVACGYAT
jgi:hypothetical protein